MPFPLEVKDWARKMRRSLEEAVDLELSLEAVINSSGQPNIKRREILEADHMFGASRKKKIARLIFYGLHKRYGFRDALESNNWTPWPHESQEVTCYGQAVIDYAVAEECGLEPRMVELVGFQKEGFTHRSGHSHVHINVGEGEKIEEWVIDPSLEMYGPIHTNGNSMKVINLAAIPERTIRRDFRTERHGFIQSIVSGEEEIVAQVNALRKNPRAMLYCGQRVGILEIDGWQSEKPMMTSWYLKFIPDRTEGELGTVVSRILIDRPGIRSKGLEYRFRIDDGGVAEEGEVIAYNCDKMVWANFTEAVPIAVIPAGDVEGLVKGLTKLSPQERASYETDVMNEPQPPRKKYLGMIQAARNSFVAATASEEFGHIVRATAAAEALYQSEKINGTYLSDAERNIAVEDLRGTHPIFDYYARIQRKIVRSNKKRRGHLETHHEYIDKVGLLLTPDQREDPMIQQYLNLQTPQQRLEFVQSSKPFYFNDVVDRLVFYRRRIKGKEGKLIEMAQEKFGQESEEQIFRGYTRVFAEVLGHLAFTSKHLMLERYREKIIRKITSS